MRGNLNELKLKESTLELKDREVELARETQSQAATLYELGSATSLDVSDSNITVYGAELDRLRNRLDVEQARLGLLYVVGLFPASHDEPARPLSDEERDRARALTAP